MRLPNPRHPDRRRGLRPRCPHRNRVLPRRPLPRPAKRTAPGRRLHGGRPGSRVSPSSQPESRSFGNRQRRRGTRLRRRWEPHCQEGSRLVRSRRVRCGRVPRVASVRGRLSRIRHSKVRRNRVHLPIRFRLSRRHLPRGLVPVAVSSTKQRCASAANAALPFGVRSCMTAVGRASNHPPSEFPGGAGGSVQRRTPAGPPAPRTGTAFRCAIGSFGGAWPCWEWARSSAR
jgi:hypothetical protein